MMGALYSPGASVALPAFHHILNTKVPTEGREDPRPINYGMELYSELFINRDLYVKFILRSKF